MTIDDDSVGYARPPKRSQFRKGQSGNPGGRPPLARDASPGGTLDPPVTAMFEGKRRRMPASDAVLLKTYQRALAGDAEATREILRYKKDQARLHGAQKGTFTLIIGDPGDAILKHELLRLAIIEEFDKGRFRVTGWAREAAEARKRAQQPPRLPPPR